MIRFILGMLFLIMQSNIVFADQYKNIALEAKQHEKEVIMPYLADAIDARRKMTLISDTKPNQPTNKKYPSVIIFVSFSMPDQSLQTILQQAKKIGASVVIRGLIHNSFKETFTKIGEIIKNSNGGGFELNPPLFKKFHIQSVPALVVLPTVDMCANDTICSEENFDVVYGNIPILDGLKAIRDHGNVSQKTASEIISKGSILNA